MANPAIYDITGGTQYLTELTKSRESNLSEITKTIEGKGDKADTADLLAMQKAMSDWSMAVNLTSTALKTAKDTLSGIIQKMG